MNIFKIPCGLYYQGRYAAEACYNSTRVTVRRVLLDYKIQMSLVTKKEKSPLFFPIVPGIYSLSTSTNETLQILLPKEILSRPIMVILGST